MYRGGTLELPPPPTPAEITARKRRRREYERIWKANEYHRANELVRARRAKWMAANPERMRDIDNRKRAKRRSAVVVKFEPAELAAKLAYWGNRCWICAGPQEAIDHVKPLAKGGPHMLANLRPICRSCNSRKRDRWPVPLGRMVS